MSEEYAPRDAFAQGRFCEGGHDMANAMTTVKAGLDEFDRMIEQVRAEERERCLKAVERQAEMTGRDINISQYREGLNDGVWRAVSAIDRLPAIRAVPEQEDRPRKFSEMRAYPGMNGIPERRTDA